MLDINVKRDIFWYVTLIEFLGALMIFKASNFSIYPAIT
jgi:hypothetical protein